MPYKNQRASKGGHSDLVRNSDVSNFLTACDYIKEPSPEEGKTIAALYAAAPTGDWLPDKVIASDASPYVSPISDKFPSTQIGYVKVSLMLVDMAAFNDLTTPDTRYVDPFKVAELHRNADAIAFTLPGSNIKYKNAPSVKDGFRLAVKEQLSDSRTSMSGAGSYTALDTLFSISGGALQVAKCAACGYAPTPAFVFNSTTTEQSCPDCASLVYATDSLRLHEEIADFGTNVSPITRFMNAVEHLMVATLVRMLADNDPETLSRLAFIIDGPLAIFGQPASISRRLMQFYHAVDVKLKKRGLAPLVLIGLQKEGQVMEHARSINPYLPCSVFRAVDDEYRQKYIKSTDSETLNFGNETYYGQDFLFKTRSGQIFCVALPYPFAAKEPKATFAKDKVLLTGYTDKLSRAFDLIRHFEFDLYESSVIPVALAHRHASISLVPGGKVLDFITRQGLSRAAANLKPA
jgi:hypothetical protein